MASSFRGRPTWSNLIGSRRRKFTVQSAPHANLYASERIATLRRHAPHTRSSRTRPPRRQPAGRRRPAPICCSTRTTRCIGRPGGRRRWPRPRPQNKPILLSVGYAACHWCHVMAHESFENDGDRRADERALRQHQGRPRGAPGSRRASTRSALALLGEQGGWPLTMFLTPEGEPFWGGTYFPPEPRWGRPGFPQVLRRDRRGLSRASPTRSRRTSRRCARRCGKLAQPERGDGIRARTSSTASPSGCCARSTASMAASATRRNSRRCRSSNCCGAPGSAAAMRAIATPSTSRSTRMCQGGIYDHLGGGFARYSTDADWLVPHFEKMLYDNAAADRAADPGLAGDREPALSRSASRETVGWAAARDADGAEADGQRGFASCARRRQRARGRQVLRLDRGRDRRACSAPTPRCSSSIYDVTPDGNWEGHTILNRIAQPGAGATTRPRRARRAAARRSSPRARQRVRPGWDDKVLADWNGLMIAALAERRRWSSSEPAWLAARDERLRLRRQAR